MPSKLIKMIFFASFVWIAGVILTQDALGADTVVYAIQYGTGSLGMLDLNTGVFTQISAAAVSYNELGVYGGALYGAGSSVVASFRSIRLPASPLSRRPISSKITVASAR